MRLIPCSRSLDLLLPIYLHEYGLELYHGALQQQHAIPSVTAVSGCRITEHQSESRSNTVCSGNSKSPGYFRLVSPAPGRGSGCIEKKKIHIHDNPGRCLRQPRTSQAPAMSPVTGTVLSAKIVSTSAILGLQATGRKDSWVVQAVLTGVRSVSRYTCSPEVQRPNQRPPSRGTARKGRQMMSTVCLRTIPTHRAQ